MKIVIQYFDDEEEAKKVVYEGDAVGEADSWKEAHDLIDQLEKGHTVPV